MFRLFATIFILGSSAFAQIATAEDSTVYEKTLDLCRNTSALSLKGYQNAFRISYNAAKETFSEIRLLSPNKELLEILNSETFNEALEQCFPRDELKKKIFVGHLLFLDAEGKAIGSLGSLYLLKYVSAGMNKLKAFSKWGYYSFNTVTASLFAISTAYEIKYANWQPTPEEAHDGFDKIKNKFALSVIDEINKAQATIQSKLNITSDEKEIAVLLKKHAHNEILRQQILASLN